MVRGIRVVRRQCKQLTVTFTVIVHDVILASGEDHNIASATRLAAAYALDALDGEPDFMTRTCDCRASQQSKKAKKMQKAQLGYE